ncbi:Uncharacterized protein OS=Blastopirellula marina DSM 3645 GN=DSM3645_07930 PE=4 SV=1: SBP_bac_10 [Gemmataceae bacterium]|nr:Uncharacterized protein OS=Blastopirellula marina DSM 3645 GN=DSM3645_07930 PE=4 SV=1: SBP_bac_10 [Gemmataceae bacterium]VTT98170.1 Uncharacterized protein OS=Blastopirellula marina DSM 3645 GN=DSM3645_07930 PE=4 SV=1: SBP_bac_10 [Gemmataceae bacterium]
MPKIVPALIAALLVAVPACKKKPAPTQPDSTPAPPPKATPAPGQSTGTPPAQPLDPSLPSPPTQRPLYNFQITVAAGRTAELENLKQIGLGFHAASDTIGGFPAGVADANGKVGLSWRVALLPFIEQDALYKQFKLDEPWDSAHNKKLIPQMPKLYAPGNTNTFGYTFLRSFSGKGTVLGDAKLPPPGQVARGVAPPVISDGASNTLLVAEAYDPIIWTKPDEPFSAAAPPRLGGGVYGNGFCALFADGAARFLPTNIPPADIGSLIQISDGRIVTLP